MTTTPLPYAYNKGSQKGSVYILRKTSDDKNSSSEEDSIVLKSRHSRSRVKDAKDRDVCDTISHEVQPRDTLTSLAIKYNCKVSEIKRINHMWNANELSA